MSFQRICVLVASLAIVASAAGLTGCTDETRGKVVMSKGEKATLDKNLKDAQEKAEKAESEAKSAKEAADQAFAAKEEALKSVAEREDQLNKNMESREAQLVKDTEQKEEMIRQKQAELEHQVELAIKQQQAAEEARAEALNVKAQIEAAIKARSAELAEANQELAKIESQAKDRDAQSQQRLTEARERAEKAAQELAAAEGEKRIAEEKVSTANQLVADAQERQQQVDKAEELWKSIFADAKLDPVFDKVKAHESIAVRVSLIGTSEATYLEGIRQRIAQVNFNKSYNDLKKLTPTAKRLSEIQANDKRAADLKAKGNKTKASFDKLFSENSPVIVNDVYLIEGRAETIKSLRDHINETNEKDGTNLLMIVRLVNKVRVSIGMTVESRESFSESQKIEDPKVVRTIRLGEHESSNLVALADLDLKNPGSYVFGADKAGVCTTLTTECLKELKNNGLLDKKIPVNPNDGFTNSHATVSEYLSKLLQNSSSQLGADLSLITSRHKRVSKGQKLAQWLGVDVGSEEEIEYNDELKPVVVGKNEVVEEVVNHDIVQKINLVFSIKMVERLPSNGLIYADTIFEKGFDKISIEDIGRGEVEMSLPISSTIGTTIDFMNAGNAYATKLGKKTPKSIFIESTMEQSSLMKEVMRTIE